MRKIKVSAPGKLMLLGEHAVVWGRPCLVTAVDRRLKISLEKLKEKFLEIEAPSVGIKSYRKNLSQLGKNNPPKKTRFVEMAVKNFADKYSLNFGIKIKTEDGPPLNYGLGSSAAITVAVLKGLTELSNQNLAKKKLFDLAYKTVLDVQGVGSGFDVAAAIYGGTIYFKTGGRKIEKAVNFDLPLVVGWSGIKADTPTLVRKVAREREKHPQIVGKIFDEIEGLVEEGRKALLKKDWQTLGELMNINQKLLENLGVSTPKLAKLIYASRQAGALGAKLSGAGGGDCMIALVDEKGRKDVEEAIENARGKVIKAKIGVERVRID